MCWEQSTLPVGSRNQFTTLKSAFIEAFEEIGGVDNLVEWARCNQTDFYRMLARLMPRENQETGRTRRMGLECKEIILNKFYKDINLKYA